MTKIPLFRDTDEDTENALIELARRTPESKKIELIWSLSNCCRDLALSGLRERYPDATDEEMHCRLAALIFDRETVIQVYGWDPKIKGY